MTAADIVLNFEGTYATYQTWQLASTDWERGYPASRFWHLVYGTGASDMPAAIAGAKQKNAGWVFVTSAGLDNPWATLPTSTYWSQELQLIASS